MLDWAFQEPANLIVSTHICRQCSSANDAGLYLQIHSSFQQLRDGLSYQVINNSEIKQKYYDKIVINMT